MPANHIMVYLIQADRFRKLCDEYPQFRSYAITRAQARRSYFIKVAKEAQQDIILQRKTKEQQALLKARKVINDPFASSDSEEEIELFAKQRSKNFDLLDL